MGSMMLLYEAVKNNLGTAYPNVFFQTMREDQPGDVGIYLYESANDREDLEGDAVYDCIKVHVQVNCERSLAGMNKAINYLTDFTKNMETLRCAVSGVQFISAAHQGPRALPIGKNQFDILVCRAVVDLKYILK